MTAPRPCGLAGLQGALGDYILTGVAPAALKAALAAPARTDAPTGLRAYRDAYELRLIEALESNYPHLKRLAGESDFTAIGRAYLARHPSRQVSIRWFGGALADFLAATAPWTHRPELAAMARFEWALTEAFDAPESTPIGLEAMAAFPPEDWGHLAFEIDPAVRRIRLDHEVASWWDALEAPHPAATPPDSQQWLVWRQELEVMFRRLDADEAVAFDALMAGASFGQLCEALAAFVGPAAAPIRAAGLLRAWIMAETLGQARLKG